jgi:cytochrome c2
MLMSLSQQKSQDRSNCSQTPSTGRSHIRRERQCTSEGFHLMKSVSAGRLFAITGVALGYALLAVPLSVSMAEAADDAKAGQAVFSRCAACHSATPGVNKIGPSLAGIVGSQSGAVPGFHFSTGMKNAKVTWDEASLDKFLQNPNGFIHGTTMFFSLPSAKDRQDVIAYLETLKR